jgi:co-chaperonin GroES (HSP10)
MPATELNKVRGDVNPLPDHILVVNMQKGETVTRGGIILTDDNGKNSGIRARWAQVYKVGTNIDWVSPGEWILVEHGRWTYGINVERPGEAEEIYLQRVDVDAVLMAADEQPF